YSLRLIPMGGYCAMEGEDETLDDPRGFRNAKLWKRMIVLVAGPMMNFILGFITLIIMVSMMTDIPTTEIKGFAGVKEDDGTITYYAESYNSGLRHGDKFYKIDGMHIFSDYDLSFILATTKLDKHEVTVIRDGKKVEFSDVVFHNNMEGGGVFDFGLVCRDKNPLSIIGCSKDYFCTMTHIVGISIKQLFSGEAKKEDISGPVGVVDSINEVAEESESILDKIFNLLNMVSLLTINIGIANLLPIPALDGGRLLFCFIELVRRKPIKPEYEGYIHLAGMVFLFGVMIFATYNDIVRIIERITSGG
nr:site-2 protease family protein [Ruminococcus sp.]